MVHTSDSGDGRGPAVRRRWFLYGAVSLAVVFTAAAMLAALAPRLLSTDPGRGFFEKLFNSRIAGSIKVDALSLSWTGRQRVEGLVLRDTGGKAVLRVGRMENNRSLWALLTRGRSDLGTTEVSGLRMDLVSDDDGEVNLVRALSPDRPGPAKPVAFPVLPFATLHAADGAVTVSAPGIEKVEFSEVSLDLEFPLVEVPARFKLSAQTRQGDLAGELTIDGTVENLVDRQGRLQLGAAKADVTIEAGNLPVDGIDHILGYRGQLTAALGRRLNLRVRTRAALEGVGFDISVVSPNLEASAMMDLKEESLLLRESTTVLFTLMPQLVHAVGSVQGAGAGLSLRSKVPLKLAIAGLRIPLGAFDPSRAEIRARLVADGDLRFRGVGTAGDITISGLKAAFDSPSLATGVRTDVSAAIAFDRGAGRVEVGGSFSRLFDGKGRFQPARAEVMFTGEVSGIPPALVDGFLRQKGLAGDLLGSSVDTSFSWQSSGTGEAAVDLHLKATRFEAEIPLLISEKISLSRAAKVRTTLSPALAAGLFPEARGISLLRPAGAALHISEFSTPGMESGRVFLDPEKTSVKADISIDPMTVTGSPLGEIDVENMRLALEAGRLDDMRVDLAGRINIKGKGLISEATGGRPVHITMKVKTGMAAEGGVLPLSADLRLESEALKGRVSIETAPPFENLALTTPLSAELKIPTSVTGRLQPAESGRISLTKSPTVVLELKPLTLPLRDFSLSALKVRSDATVAEVELTAGEKGGSLLVRDLSAQVDFDGPAGIMGLTLKGAPAVDGATGSPTLQAEIRLSSFLNQGRVSAEEATLEAVFNGRGLPVSLAGLFIEESGKLASLAGEEVNLAGSYSRAPLQNGKGEIKVEAVFPRLRLDADLTLADTIHLNAPATFDLTLTPSAYASLTDPTAPAESEGSEQGRFILEDKAVLKGRLSSLQWPRAGRGLKGKSGAAALEADIEAQKLLFRDAKSGKKIGLEGIKLSARGGDLGKELVMEAGCRITGTGTGKIQVGAVLSDLFDRDGRFNRASLSARVTAGADAVPVSLMDEWFSLQGLGAATLGESVSLKADANLKRGEGPVSVRADATHARLDLEGRVAKGAFRLNRPLVGELEVTEELGRRLLNKIHPLFETVQTSREPLILEIAPDGFLLPLRDFSIDKMTIPSLSVASNRLVLKKGGLLAMLIPLAQSFGGMKGVGGEPQTEVWFTRLVAQMRGGVFSYSNRLDLLIDRRLHAISWGTVAMGGEGGGSSRYDLKLGLPADALRKILGTKRIREGEVLVIPLQGREGGMDSKAVFSRAALDLGRVRGQYELSQKDPLLGLVAGEIAKQAIGTGTGSIPPPSMSPLPWAELMEPEPPAPDKQEPPPPADKRQREQKIPEEIEKILPKELKGIFDLIK